MEQPSWWHKAFPAALKIPGNPGGKELLVRNPGYVGKMMLRFPSQEQQAIVKGHLYTSLMIHQNIPMFPWFSKIYPSTSTWNPPLIWVFCPLPEKIITNWQLWRTNRMELRDLGIVSRSTFHQRWQQESHGFSPFMRWTRQCFWCRFFTSQFCLKKRIVSRRLIQQHLPGFLLFFLMKREKSRETSHNRVLWKLQQKQKQKTWQTPMEFELITTTGPISPPLKSWPSCTLPRRWWSQRG